jgi:ferrochelatase
MPSYDAVLLVSFGGPEGREDVIPFLENVLRGRNVPRERMLEVAEHYYQFGGVSPINEQNRQLRASLESILGERGPALPVYWGNRNWRPLLPDVVLQMRDDGVRRALAFVTSAFSSYSGCRQYRENLAAACTAVGPGAPQIDKLRVFYNHPSFIEVVSEGVQRQLEQLTPEESSRCVVLFSAHSIPRGMAENCRYEAQLREASRLVAERLKLPRWELVYQSRSGPPSQPWLEPDVAARIEQLASSDHIRAAIVVPLGFVSDHVEVLFDLDEEAAGVCRRLGVRMLRAPTAGTHPEFVEMIRQLILERIDPSIPKLSKGVDGPSHDVCPEDCCLYAPARPGVASR